MIYWKIYVFLFLTGCTSSVFAQVLTVRDYETDAPIEGVLISNHSRTLSVQTNENGQADMGGFVPTDTIITTLIGYHARQVAFHSLEKSGFILRLTPSILTMTEVTVGATRWKESTGTSPAKVSIISRREIDLHQPQTAADLLNVSGKVFMQKSQQGGGSPMIRGFAANRLLIAVDGIRMNTAIFRGGNLHNVISLDPFMIEQADVVLGPGSVIYGSDAIGGVMHFQSLRPEPSGEKKVRFKGGAGLRYSSANQERTGHAHVHAAWERWALIAGFSRQDYDDLIMGRHGPEDYLRREFVRRIGDKDSIFTNPNPRRQVPSGYDQYNITGKLRFQPSAQWDILVAYHASATSDFSRYDRHLRYRQGKPRYGEWSYGPQKWQMIAGEVTHRANSKVYDDAVLRVAKQFFEESRISRNLNSVKRETTLESINAYSVNLDMRKALRYRSRLSYGIEYLLNDVQSSGRTFNIETAVTNDGPSRYPDALWQGAAVYALYDDALSDQWTWQAGMRYNHFWTGARFEPKWYSLPFETVNTNHGALSGSVGSIFRPTGWLTARVNLGSAFRAPNVDDMGKVFDSEPGAVTVPNPDLRSEYAWSADAGLTAIIWEKLKIDVNGYYILLTDAMVRRDYRLNGQDSILYEGTLHKVQAIQNAAYVRVAGLQLGIECLLPAGFTIGGDVNIQRGEEEMDDGTKSAARHAAPFFSVARLGWRHKGVRIEVNTMYQGAVSYDRLAIEERGKKEIYASDSNGQPWAPAWYTLNMKSSWMVTKYLTLGVGVENITDRRYRPYSSGISGAGRNMVLSLQARF